MRQRRKPLSALLSLAVFATANSYAAEQEADASLEPLDCVINPSVVADLGSSVPGVLSSVLVDRSDFVRKGEVVAKLESAVEEAAVDLAQTRAGLTSEVELRRINAAFGRRQYQRTNNLFERQVISTNDRDERETEAKVAQVQLRQARENLRLAELESVRAQQILARRTVFSPVTGVVMDRFRTVGEYVEDKPIVRVAQLDPLHVEVIVPVGLLGKVRNGMQAEVWSEAVGDTVWRAQVSRVDRVADVASGTYGVRLTMANPEYRIPAGLRCRVRFDADSAITEVDDWPPRAVFDRTEGDVTVSVTDNGEQVAAASADNATTGDPEPPGDPVCQWFGPYSDRAAAEAAAAPLRDDGAAVQVTQTPVDDTTSEFNVVSATLANRTESDAYLQRLRDAKVEDYFLMGRKGGLRRVSLGLYKNRRVAERRVADLTQRGFSVEMKTIPNGHSHHWVQIDGDLSALDPAKLAALPVDDSTIPPSTDCPRFARR